MQGKIRTVFATLGMLTMAVAIGGACKKPEAKRRSAKLMKAAVADFDPTNTDFTVNLDKWGSERPDDYAIEQAFTGSFAAMDACVAEYKSAKGIKPDKTLRGEIEVAVRLNPAKGPPLGVNAKLPGKYDNKNSLKDCIREAAAGAPYPKYDGPPITATFQCELDAGSEYWED